MATMASLKYSKLFIGSNLDIKESPLAVGLPVMVYFRDFAAVNNIAGIFLSQWVIILLYYFIS